jgi:hypothetical protein
MEKWVNGEFDFAANSNLTKCFLNLNEDIEHIGGIRGAEIQEHRDIGGMGIVGILGV